MKPGQTLFCDMVSSAVGLPNHLFAKAKREFTGTLVNHDIRGVNYPTKRY